MHERLLEHIWASTEFFADQQRGSCLKTRKALFPFPAAIRLKTGRSFALLLSGGRATGALAGAAIGAARGAAVGVDSARAGRVPAASALRTLEKYGRCLLLRRLVGHFGPLLWLAGCAVPVFRGGRTVVAFLAVARAGFEFSPSLAVLSSGTPEARRVSILRVGAGALVGAGAGLLAAGGDATTGSVGTGAGFAAVGVCSGG